MANLLSSSDTEDYYLSRVAMKKSCGQEQIGHKHQGFQSDNSSMMIQTITRKSKAPRCLKNTEHQ